MKWKHPPTTKIYEALGALADGRVEVAGNLAKVYSSSGNKFYTVTFDKASESIMVNDNASFYQGYLGYPAVAYLMYIGEIEYSPVIAKMLKGIAWKDINQRFKNDFEKALEYILSSLPSGERMELDEEVLRINAQLQNKEYNYLGEKVRPPQGY